MTPSSTCESSFRLLEILDATGGELFSASKAEGIPAGTLSTDSRTLAPGQWFIPIVGERFDGHTFVAEAIAKGVTGCLVQASHVAELSDAGMMDSATCPIVVVNDTTLAYLAIAGWFRQHKRGEVVVIGVTGSSGKTTVKEMLVAALSPYKSVASTPKNFNNDIGVAQTLLACPDTADILVVEMGMRGLGEIQRLSEAACPNIAVITSIGSAHIGRLGSRKAIAQAKAEITAGIVPHPALPQSPAFIFPHNEPLLAPWVKALPEAVTLHPVTAQPTSISSPWAGDYMQSNVNIVAAVGQLCGLDPQDLERSLARYQPPEGRGKVYVIRQQPQVTVIEDAYNANPESMRASIQAFISAYPQAIPILVLGGMKELGDHSTESHASLLNFVARQLSQHPMANQACVWLIGDEYTRQMAQPLLQAGMTVNFSDTLITDIVAQSLRESISAPDERAILIKGSRAYRLETLVPALQSLVLPQNLPSTV